MMMHLQAQCMYFMSSPFWLNKRLEKFVILLHLSYCWWHEYISIHYNDIIMGAIASQITSLASIDSAVWLDADQRKHQSSASQAFVRGNHRRPASDKSTAPSASRTIKCISGNSPVQYRSWGYKFGIKGSIENIPLTPLRYGSNMKSVISKHMLRIKFMGAYYEIATDATDHLSL